MKDMKLQEIYEANLKTGECVQRSHFNDAALAECYVAKPKRLDYAQTPDPLWGWVLEPKDYDSSKKYPAILDIHGGPRASYGPVFYHEMQLWANEGYFVFFCNVHGSDGRGDAFADLRGKFGTIDFDDFMQFTDAVLKAYPQIDAKRIGVTGGSYGGYMTNWIIGHTDRFACAASQRSISNWVSENMVSDIGFSFGNDQMDATPWSDVNKIWDQSPLKAADQCVTPTLFIHSFEDYRCPIQEGMQMYNALVHHGVEARMCLFKGRKPRPEPDRQAVPPRAPASGDYRMDGSLVQACNRKQIIEIRQKTICLFSYFGRFPIQLLMRCRYEKIFASIVIALSLFLVSVHATTSQGVDLTPSAKSGDLD